MDHVRLAEKAQAVADREPVPFELFVNWQEDIARLTKEYWEAVAQEHAKEVR